MEKVKKNDFVELEFIGRNLVDNEVFDTNMPEEAKKINTEIKTKPLVISVGNSMLVKGFDESLIEKETGKKYKIKISPENAFGKRNPQLIRLVPLKAFTDKKVYPQPGMPLALDNNVVKVISVSGGRVMVDFNNPLAGKEVEYEFTIKRKVDDLREKVNAIQNFFFGKEFEFDIDLEKKKILFKDINLTPVLNAFHDKFKEMTSYDVEILAKAAEKEKANPENKEKSK